MLVMCHRMYTQTYIVNIDVGQRTLARRKTLFTPDNKTHNNNKKTITNTCTIALHYIGAKSNCALRTERDNNLK